jgi:RNA polymerase sigma-54 factor
MKTSLHQSTVLRQDMRMNPRLYQAMDLLYMPLLDLQQHLKTELLSNPFLELVDEDDDLPAEKSAEEQEKEREDAEKENEMDWEDILMDGFQVGGSRGEYEEREMFERTAVASRNLTDHLRDQLTLLELTPRQQVLADEFLGNIGEDGYLQASLEEIVAGANNFLDDLRRAEEEDGRPDAPPAASTTETQATESAEGGGKEAARGVFDVTPLEEEMAAVARASVAVADSAQAGSAPAEAGAAEAGAAGASTEHPDNFTLKEAEDLLAIFQELDPPGIAARDLRECLLIQLRDQALSDTLTYQLVHDAFDDLIAHRWSDLAKRFGLEPRAVQDAADLLAKLDPKPGLQYASGDDVYVTPDLILEKIDGEYRVFLNDTGVPRLRISKVYQELAGDKKKFQGENRDFVTNKLNSATWLIQAIEQRRQTMLKVMNFIVDRQRDFFEKGVEHLKPLTLREVADVINMHESTVSRVTNQKYVQTPRGVLPLKFFFSSSLGTSTGEDASARSVKAQIQKLVGDENPKKPLTDSDLVNALQARGIKIARRTVAKYRDQLGILPARMRKRV